LIMAVPGISSAQEGTGFSDVIELL